MFYRETYIYKDGVYIIRETVALKAGQVRSKIVRCKQKKKIVLEPRGEKQSRATAGRVKLTWYY